MKTVYLHIGTENTGAASIQDFCSEHRPQLESEGLLYPRLGFAPEAHFSLVAPLHPADNDGAPLEFAPAHSRDFETEWGPLGALLERDDERDILLSAEHFSSRLGEWGIRRIGEFFSRYADRVRARVVVFLRRQDDFLVSTYTTMVRFGSTLDFKELLDGYRAMGRRMDYAALLHRWGEVLGRENLLVRVFEPEQMPEGLLHSFFETVGVRLDSDLLRDYEVRRRAWPIEVVELARELHRSFPQAPIHRRIELLDEVAASVDGTSADSLLGNQERQEILDFFEESNREVARDFLGRPDGELFLASSCLDVPERGIRDGCDPDLLRELLEKAGAAFPREVYPPDASTPAGQGPSSGAPEGPGGPSSQLQGREDDRPLVMDVLRLSQEVADLRGREAELQGQLARLRHSWSWRWTSPFRWGWESRPLRGLRSAIRLPAKTLSGEWREEFARKRTVELIRSSGLFDEVFYLARYPDIAASGVDPLLHFVDHGADQGLWPNPLFDTPWYGDLCPELVETGRNPLEHYISEGEAAGKQPNPCFDPEYYRSTHPDVEEEGGSALLHYLRLGSERRYRPGPCFDGAAYLAARPDVELAGMDPLIHHLLHGEPRICCREQRGHPGDPDRRVSSLSEGAPANASPLQAPAASFSRAAERAACAKRSEPRTARVSDGSAILIIDDRVPEFDSDSGSCRMHAIVRLLAEDVRVVFHPLVLSSPPRYSDSLEEMGVEVLPLGSDLAEFLRRRGREFDTVVLSRPEVACRALPAVLSHVPGARVIYDTVDLHWVRLRRGAETTGCPEMGQEARRFRRLERACSLAADTVITITEEEASILEEAVPGVDVRVVPNIHEARAEVPDWGARSDLVFIGGYHHRPNVDAVHYFLDEVFPGIQRELPGVRFVALGTNPTADLLARASKDVEVPGYVEDVSPLFDRARVFVAPLRYGAGMKGKVGQSMAEGVPVVTTRIGAEGIGLVDGETALIRDSPEEFAAAVVELYRDEELWRRLSEAARRYLQERFSSDAIRDQLRAVLVSDGAPGSPRQEAEAAR